MDKPAHQSLTLQGAAALVVFAALVPVLARAGVTVTDEVRQAVLLIIGAVITYGLRRAVGRAG